MKELAFWEFALKHLQTGWKLALLAVLQSKGSSPGRQGFKMIISETGEMAGSIGGGIMEYKLVELARNLLAEDQKQPVLKHQVHSKSAAWNRSGMICSGEQTVAILFLNATDLLKLENLVETLQSGKTGILSLTANGLDFNADQDQIQQFTFSAQTQIDWAYTEKMPVRAAVFIIGGGHISLALSRVLQFLYFDIHLFDDRQELNTFDENQFVNSKTVTPYSEIGSFIPEGKQTYVVIMTIGYRTDKEVIIQLLDKDLGYLGLLGSKAKVAEMFNELEQEGFSETELQKVHAPIGIAIKSQTPEEIAISIAAEIIQVKNG